MLFEPSLEGMVGREGLDQLELGVTHVEMGESHRACHDVFAVEQRKPELVAPEFQGLFGVRHGDGKVVETVVRERRHWNFGITIYELRMAEGQEVDGRKARPSGQGMEN